MKNAYQRYILIISLLMTPLASSADFIMPSMLEALPVQISIPISNGSIFGTGILLSQSNKLFLVTASHCIFNPHSTNRTELLNSNAVLTSSGLYNSKEKTYISIDLNNLNNSGYIKRHSTHDIAVVYLGAVASNNSNTIVKIQLNNFAHCTQTSSSGISEFDLKGDCIYYTNILEGEETYTFGFPVDLENTPYVREIDFNNAVIKKGIVAQKNLNTQKIIIDSAVYGGNSGGPVVIVDNSNPLFTTYKIGGIIVEQIPATAIQSSQGAVFVNSGYSVAEPIDNAIELINEFK